MTVLRDDTVTTVMNGGNSAALLWADVLDERGGEMLASSERRDSVTTFLRTFEHAQCTMSVRLAVPPLPR